MSKLKRCECWRSYVRYAGMQSEQHDLSCPRNALNSREVSLSCWKGEKSFPGHQQPLCESKRPLREGCAAAPSSQRPAQRRVRAPGDRGGGTPGLSSLRELAAHRRRHRRDYARCLAVFFFVKLSLTKAIQFPKTSLCCQADTQKSRVFPPTQEVQEVDGAELPLDPRPTLPVGEVGAPSLLRRAPHSSPGVATPISDCFPARYLAVSSAASAPRLRSLSISSCF